MSLPCLGAVLDKPFDVKNGDTHVHDDLPGGIVLCPPTPVTPLSEGDVKSWNGICLKKFPSLLHFG